MRLSERLTQLRIELGITQKELADRLGVSRGTVGMYEVFFNQRVKEIHKRAKEEDKHAVNNFDDTTQNEYFSISELRKFIKEQRKKRKGK